MFVRRLSMLVLALAAVPAFAQQVPSEPPPVEQQPYRAITAKELLGGVMDGSLAAWVKDPAQRTMLSTLMATSYILGSADSRKDIAWCPPKDLPIEAVSQKVLDYLADLPPAKQEENASRMVTEGLSKAYPCKR